MPTNQYAGGSKFQQFDAKSIDHNFFRNTTLKSILDSPTDYRCTEGVYLNCTNVRGVLLSLGGIRHFFECNNDTEKCQPCYRDKDVVITQAALYSYKIWVISFLFSSFFTFSKISFLVFFESERVRRVPSYA